MCQWFTGDYRELVRQIEADAVTANIDQSEAFLAPRTQALTQTPDPAGDVHFAIYEGEAFYRFWQHLSNVGIGIQARNTAWVNGPSVERVKHWGSQINRTRVCE